MRSIKGAMSDIDYRGIVERILYGDGLILVPQLQ